MALRDLFSYYAIISRSLGFEGCNPVLAYNDSIAWVCNSNEFRSVVRLSPLAIKKLSYII